MTNKEVRNAAYGYFYKYRWVQRVVIVGKTIFLDIIDSKRYKSEALIKKFKGFKVKHRFVKAYTTPLSFCCNKPLHFKYKGNSQSPHWICSFCDTEAQKVLPVRAPNNLKIEITKSHEGKWLCDVGMKVDDVNSPGRKIDLGATHILSKKPTKKQILIALLSLFKHELEEQLAMNPHRKKRTKLIVS